MVVRDTLHVCLPQQQHQQQWLQQAHSLSLHQALIDKLDAHYKKGDLKDIMWQSFTNLRGIC